MAGSFEQREPCFFDRQMDCALSHNSSTSMFSSSAAKSASSRRRKTKTSELEDNNSHSVVVSTSKVGWEHLAEHVSVVSDLTCPNSDLFLESEISASDHHHHSAALSSHPEEFSMNDESSILRRAPEINFEKVGLVNREPEIKVVRRAIDSVINGSSSRSTTSSCQRGLIALSGYSGSGKTFLAREASLALVKENNIYFGQGKWSQTDSQDPLSVLQSAIRQIGYQINSSKESSSEGGSRFSEQILKEFEDQPDFIRTWMPDLLNDNGTINFPSNGVDSEDAKPPRSALSNQSIEQVQFATTTLLSLIDRPVLLLLDSAQLADRVSLELLRSWLSSNSTLRNLVVVACFRTEGVQESHILSTHLFAPLEEQNDRCKAQGVVNPTKITKLCVLDFNTAQTNNFLGKLLGQTKEDTEELSELLQKKTGGNPLFLASSIKFLLESDVISFNPHSMRWIWDIRKVAEVTDAADNVVELLRKKMDSSHEARSILPIAALLGSTFHLELLVKVSGELACISRDFSGIIDPLEGMSQIEVALQACEEQGFIDRFDRLTSSTKNCTMPQSLCSEVSYRFVHDRIQEAALALLSSQDLKNLQVMMGKILIESLLDDRRRIPADASDLIVFWAVNVLNEANLNADNNQDIKIRPLSRNEMIHLNYTAGVRAMSKASFELAGDYFSKAIYEISQRTWKRARQECIDLYTKAAQAAYSRGATQMMEIYLDILLSRGDVDLMAKMDAYFVRIRSNLAAEGNEEAYLDTLDIVEKLGVRFPQTRAAITIKTISGLLKIKGTARTFTEEDILKLPRASDPRESAILRALDMFVVVTYAWKPSLAPLIALEMVKRVFRNGLTEYSCVGIAMLGGLMTIAFSDFKATENCYNLAAVAFKRVPSTFVESRYTYLSEALLAPWFKPLQDTLPNLARAYKIGLLSGDLESAGFAMSLLVERSLHTGRPLSLIESQCIEIAQRLQDFSQLKQKRMLLYSWRVCRMLQGQSSGDDILNLEKEIEHLEASKDLTLTIYLRRSQMFLAVSMGDFESCAELALDWADLAVKTLVSQSANIRVRFHAALSGYIMAQRGGDKSYKKMAKRNAAVIEGWLKQGNPNCLHLNAILEAEKACLSGKTRDAISAYEVAIALSAQQEMIHEQAIACERYADLLWSMGRQAEARDRLEDSIALHKRWGATAKVSYLQTRHVNMTHSLRQFG